MRMLLAALVVLLSFAAAPAPANAVDCSAQHGKWAGFRCE